MRKSPFRDSSQSLISRLIVLPSYSPANHLFDDTDLIVLVMNARYYSMETQDHGNDNELF